MDLFIIVGKTMKDILPGYYRLTGTPAVPPKWSFGIWMSKISYGTRKEVERVAAKLREYELPCDVIHIDTDWFAENWVCDWKFTGVQRVVKESIFSQFNNPQIYTVVDQEYAPYFGLNKTETESLLKDYGLELDDDVQKMYDGYVIGGIEMYNPWSIINYAKKGRLENYWVKTSSNFLVKSALSKADKNFWTSVHGMDNAGHLIFGT